jgi:hypothetical protein
VNYKYVKENWKTILAIFSLLLILAAPYLFFQEVLNNTCAVNPLTATNIIMSGSRLIIVILFVVVIMLLLQIVACRTTKKDGRGNKAH